MHCFRSFFCRLLLILPLTSGAIGMASAASEQELKGVKNEIERQNSSLSQQAKKLDSIQSQLKQQELSISKLERAIAQSKKNLESANANLANTASKIAQLEKQQQDQQEKLAALIKAYYLMHQSQSPQQFLSDGAKQDRMSQYYQHLAAQRTQTLEALNATHEELAQQNEKQAATKSAIETLLTQQRNQYQGLKDQQAKRSSTVKQLKASVSSDKAYLSELKRNESRLKAELAKAAKRNAVPMDGLSKQQRRLPWPVSGKLLHTFGSRQTGQLKWKGIVVASQYGQPVKAVYPGVVVFSEYLRGYGLMVLIDHGRGDMTLYGFNQSLVKKEGDKVLAGETIAFVGDTGGQSTPSLYFEVRRNSVATNPLSWLKR